MVYMKLALCLFSQALMICFGKRHIMSLSKFQDARDQLRLDGTLGFRRLLTEKGGVARVAEKGYLRAISSCANFNLAVGIETTRAKEQSGSGG
jgi:hypothetical protein